MTIISILIGRKGKDIDNTIILTNVFNLGDFYYFEKKGIRELSRFIARNSFSRSENGKIVNIQHKGFYITVVSDYEGLSICAVRNNNDYPIRVLHRILKDLLVKYKDAHSDKWKTFNIDLGLPMKGLGEKIIEISNPEKVDKIFKINKDLDNTIVIMHQNIDKILERGEKIEDLVQRSKDLSKTSKNFYRTSKKFNKCCLIS